MGRKGRPKRENQPVVKGKRGRPRTKQIEEDPLEPPVKRKRGRPRTKRSDDEECRGYEGPIREPNAPDPNYTLGLHMSSAQIHALSNLVACVDCGEEVTVGVRPTTKGMISECTVACKVCDSQKSTNTPNLIRERKRKHEKKGVILQKTENINYAHVAAFLDNGLGYSGLRHYCKYFNARCLNEATFVCYSKQVIADVVADGEDFLQQNARIVRRVFESQLESDFIVDLTVSYTTTYHQWGSDFCLVAGAVIELQTGLVLDYDVANMYCHVCKINAKKIVSMSPAQMTAWFTKHQDTCEIREWCDEIDQENEESLKEIDPKYLESFIAKKIWGRSLEKFGFRYSTLIHESDEKIHAELLKAAPYDDIPVMIDSITNSFSRRKSEHARTAFQNKLKSKCPRERVQTKDRVMYVYAMSIPEYNKFAIGSNIRLRELVRQMETEEREYALSVSEIEFFSSIKDKDTPDEYANEMREVGDAFVLEGEVDDELPLVSIAPPTPEGKTESSSNIVTTNNSPKKQESVLQNGIDKNSKVLILPASKSPSSSTEVKKSSTNITAVAKKIVEKQTSSETTDSSHGTKISNIEVSSSNNQDQQKEVVKKNVTVKENGEINKIQKAAKNESSMKPFRVELDE